MILSRPNPTPLLVLLAAAGLALGGLGLATQALLRPVPQVLPLTPVVAGDEPLPGPALASDWASLFGTAPPPAPEPLAAPEPEPDLEPLDTEPAWFDPESLILRGLVAEDDGGLAFVEIGGEIVVVREGDVVLDGVTIGAILPRGLEVEFDGEAYLIEFDEAAATAPPPALDTTRPPAGSLDVPSFSGYSGGQTAPAQPANRFGISR